MTGMNGMTGPAEPLLAIEQLQIEVGHGSNPARAVRGVDLAIERGGSLGLVGESGSGKTLTALSIVGLLPPSGRIAGGTIRFDGRDVTELAPRALEDLRGDRIGVVFQEPMTALNPTRRVGEQVAETLRRHRGLVRSAAWEQAVAMLDRVGIVDAATAARRYPHQLSGGQRQRVMIAAAIVCEPELLIADEPTTALDVTVQAQILDLLDELRQQHRMALLLVTHDLGVVSGRVDDVAAMYAGRVVEAGPAKAVIEQPRHPYLGALLDSLPERALEGDRRVVSIGGQAPDTRVAIVGCSYAPRCARAVEVCRERAPEVTVDGDRRVECFVPLDAGPRGVAHDARPARGIDDATVLELHGVVRRYPLRSGFGRAGTLTAVDGVSLSVTRGESLGVVGESGSGKSTLGRIAAGLERADAGSVRLVGVDADGLRGTARRRHRARAQLVFQDSAAALDPRMAVGAAIAEPLAIQGVPRAERRQRVAALLDAVGLPAESARRYPHEFSGGQRQRIVIARALAPSPDLVVADEPVSALDVSVQAQILNLLDDLRAERGLTYLFISHDLAVIRYMTDRVAVMYRGSVVETGPSAAVHDTPWHPYTRLLVDSIPTVDGAPGPQAPPAPSTPPAAPASDGCRFRHRCPYALDRCAVEVPELRGDGDRSVACHAPLVSFIEGGRGGG